MATMQKPKKERAKKSRNKQNEVLEKEDEYDEEINNQLDLNKALIVPEISRPTFHEFSTICEKKEENRTPEQLVKDVPVIINTHEPTAPPENETADSKFNPLLIPEPIKMQYPNLQLLHHEETKSKIVYRYKHSSVSILDDNKMIPFSLEQMQEFYHCEELDLVNQFELEFLTNSLLETHEGDPLHMLLQEYYGLQSKLSMMRCDVTQIRKESLEAQRQIWLKIPITKSFSARCADGKLIYESVTYNIIQIDGKNLQDTSDSLQQIFDLVCYKYATNSIAASITKKKIDDIVNTIISEPTFAEITNKSKMPAIHSSLDLKTVNCASHLRRAISILFAFVRKLSPNKEFTKDVRAWLTKLVSVQLLVATKEDHWFLLFNILRCPSGVGAWATSFLQFPNTTISSNADNTSKTNSNKGLFKINSIEMNHRMSVLQVLLLPIKKRNAYLQAHKDILDPVNDECWTLVDSDGEDSHTSMGDCNDIKESDLISLLSQIPFEEMFMSALNIEKFLGDYIIEPNYMTGNQVLRMVAFFSKLINLFGEGMITYNTTRYKQLSKRLGRLMRHTLQYAIDLHQLFINNKLTEERTTCNRITLELNVLLFRACSFIYNSRNLATWQYFSTLPFTTLNTDTLWQIFYFLNIGFPVEYPSTPEDYMALFQSEDFWNKFNIANADSSPEDLYYLLQSFFEIANERDMNKDWELIKAICLQIFYIGFVNEPTRDICYKTSRDMLVNLTLAYDNLISYLLMQLKIRILDIENPSYLLKSLPLMNWKPDMESFEVLSNWLLHYDFHTMESMLARLIISHLNWGFDCNEKHLFLPHNIHVRMACLVTEALAKQAPEVIGIVSLTDTVRQMSKFLDFTHITKEQFSSWCWNMVSMLRLHMVDQAAYSIKHILHNPTETLLFVSELERLDLIYQGVTENRPLAIYVAMLVSLHGHSIPLICQKGFNLLKQLLNDNRHAAVIRCIELIVPLFLSTPETLANCEEFQNIMLNLLYADKTYIKMAKDVIYANSVGPILELLNDMIHYQITNYTRYGLASPLNLINVWLNCLTTVPSWQNTSVVYLLDKILQVAYQFPDARPQALVFFDHYYKECDEWKGNNKKSALKSLFGTGCSRVPPLLPQYAWLAAVLLEIEFKTQDLTFWNEFLLQLALTDSKNGLESALKKTVSICKFTPFQANMLVLYKYATLISGMEVAHPLFPILNQKFFELYLSRLPLHADEHRFQTIFGVSDKFYEYNVPLMKKLKNNLKSAENYYVTEATKVSDNGALCYFYGDCAKIMKAFALWLEETSICKNSKDDQNFPPQFRTEKLREILNGNTSHWTEFIYLPILRTKQKAQAQDWANRCLRSKSLLRLPTAPKSKTSATTPSERIKSQLSSYEKMQSPPYFEPLKQQVKQNVDMKTFKELQIILKTLNNTANKFHYQTCELSSLVRNYLELVPQLYVMQTYTQVFRRNCGWMLQNCKGSAVIEASIENITTNKNVEEKISTFCDRHENLIDQLLGQKMDDFVCNHQKLSNMVKLIVTQHTAAPNELQIITVTGINLFYEIVENLNDITMKFPTTNELYIQTLQDLSIIIQDNQEKEGLSILRLVLKRPDLAKFLYAVFMPSRTRAEFLLPMYSFLIDSYLKRCDTKILFVLLSKFDLKSWLETFHPKLIDINKLLHLVIRGLECWSKPEASLLQDQFRRHLVHIFNYDFPQHYGEVMQLLLIQISDHKLMPEVLLDILNSLLLRSNCTSISINSSDQHLQEVAAEFSRRQTLFNLTASTEICLMFSRHFQKERLQHGLHGLYPKYKNYCRPLDMWFSCIGHILVTSSICTYQDLLADQICDIIFGYIADMYAPWLITYTEQTLPEPTANWIRQLRDQEQMLLPWSEQHANTCKLMIKPFINTLSFVLENLPASHKILDHTFSWYVHHFAICNIEKHIHTPIQTAIATLPWERFKPQLQYLDMLYDSLQKFIPECHAMLGHIFIRINWNNWFVEMLPSLNTLTLQTHAVSRLFCIFVKIAFEPNIHIQPNLSRILEDSIQYPWHLVTYSELENLFKWFVETVDPCLVLKMPIETNYADRAVLELLQLVCAMRSEQRSSLGSSNATSKRILYVRLQVQLLRMCVAKNQKLLGTKEGSNLYKAIFLEFLGKINNTLNTLAETQTQEECKREALNLIIEILVPMQTQSTQTSNLHIEAIIEWQNDRAVGSLLFISTLNAIGHMKTFIAGIYGLLESTISHYFHNSEKLNQQHCPSWIRLLREVQMSVDKLELMPCIQGPYLHTLHLFIICHLSKLTNNGEKIVFLQHLVQLVETIKSTPSTEPRLATVWGVLISRGSQILVESPHVKKPLLMLARHLQILSSQSEGWGDGLLGAIGLKKETVTNNRRFLTRCLACVIFSLFPNINSANEIFPNQDFNNAFQELSSLLANKKYLEFKSLIVQAISMINEHKIPNLNEVSHLISRLIGIFYESDFLITIPELWHSDFQLT